MFVLPYRHYYGKEEAIVNKVIDLLKVWGAEFRDTIWDQIPKVEQAEVDSKVQKK